MDFIPVYLVRIAVVLSVIAVITLIYNLWKYPKATKKILWENPKRIFGGILVGVYAVVGLIIAFGPMMYGMYIMFTDVYDELFG